MWTWKLGRRPRAVFVATHPSRIRRTLLQRSLQVFIKVRFGYYLQLSDAPPCTARKGLCSRQWPSNILRADHRWVSIQTKYNLGNGREGVSAWLFRKANKCDSSSCLVASVKIRVAVITSERKCPSCESETKLQWSAGLSSQTRRFWTRIW
jgi:hypothetical protein